jgi:predicted TIM-barrel fold metal-dependent hydrolase
MGNAMIVDCHAHVFQSWEGACGHSSGEIHRRYIQKVQTRTSARVYRARDGKQFSGQLLFKEGQNGWSGLKDVNFRIGNWGRLDFTIDGEDYHSQYMPVGMQSIVAPPELMLAQMLDAGVDHTVLQTGWGYGKMNDYNAFAQNQYPDKFTAMLQVDEPRAYTDENMRELDRAISVLGLKAVYFALDGYARYDFDITFDDPRMEPFWSEIDAAKLPVFFEATAIPDYKEENYVTIMRSLHTLMQRYRNIRWVLVMGPPVGFFGQSGKWQFPEDVMKTYKHENMLIEIMFPITWGGKWDYPYPEAQGFIKGMHDMFGASKLIWGSDMPNVERFCTYKQSLDYVKRYCTFFKSGEMDAILGGNVDKLLKISERIARPQAQAAK